MPECKIKKKRIIVEKCAECPHRLDFDDGDECKPFALELLNPHDCIHPECELDDHPELDQEFEDWINKFYPQVSKEWELYLFRKHV